MIEHVLETGSTNADMLARAARGEPIDGQWLVAERQSAGRGRLGRAWTSATGNFHGSTGVAIRPGDPPAPTLALVAGLALHRALCALDGACGSIAIKWPNDLMIGPAKLAGILLERIGDHVVAGFGVNLAYAPALPDRPTAALAEMDVMLTPATLAELLAATFAEELQRWRADGIGETARRWQAHAHPPGTRLSVSDSRGPGLAGVYGGLDESGALRLRSDDGALRIITAGDIHVVDLP